MKWNVGAKIGAVFGIALLMLIIVGTTGYQSTTKLVEAANLRKQSYDRLDLLGDIFSLLKDAESSQRGFILTGDQRFLQVHETVEPGIRQSLAAATGEAGTDFGQDPRLTRLQALINAKLASLQKGIELRKETGAEAAREWVANGTGKDEMDAIRALVADMEGTENSRLKARSQETDKRARGALTTIVAASVAAMIILGISGLVLTRNIAGPLKKITAMAEQIAEGDLNIHLPEQSREDEVGILTRTFGRMAAALQKMAGAAAQIAAGDLRVRVDPQSEKDVLGNAFASMTDNLRKLTSQISEGINVLGASASQISTSTSQFAATATETASAVTQTTTTVEEVRQTAHLASQKAKTVSETAQRVVEVSQNGKSATDETLEGMTRIRTQMESIAESMVRLSEQSQAIGQIVNTVEDIAAQSNLLAVNASIEAAKAGEHGRGFTVVAQEVRSLAEQSKQATAQVRGILNDIQKATSSAVMATEQGGKVVEYGVKQSSQAGQSIQALATSIAEAAQAAAQIAASSQQQLVGVDQVASAMESIRQASQQNVESAHQLEKSARDLKELGTGLRNLMAQYKL